jgi:hypothetical protein
MNTYTKTRGRERAAQEQVLYPNRRDVDLHSSSSSTPLHQFLKKPATGAAVSERNKREEGKNKKNKRKKDVSYRRKKQGAAAISNGRNRPPTVLNTSVVVRNGSLGDVALGNGRKC